MNVAIGHRDRYMGCYTRSYQAADVRGAAIRVASPFRRSPILWTIAAALLFQAITAVAATVPPAWSLIPQPVETRFAPGALRIADGASVAVHGEELRPIADRFVQLIAQARGLRLHVATSAETHPAISFNLDPHAAVAENSGYRIEVGAEGIRVIARSAAGAFYGGVTVWQLLTPPGWSRGSAAEVALGVIDDHPRLSWRALLLDSGRHFQSVEDIKKLIDWMSLDKLNVLLWHLTEDQGWRVEITKYPELTKTGACRKAVGLDVELTGAADRPYCGFYTQAEVRDIVRYASERFVTIVPEIDLPGHSQATVAAYPWVGVTGKRPTVWTDWGISPWLLKPDEKALQFVDDVLDEVMALFPSKYISIGGDEADKQQWNASAALRAQMQRLGLANMDQLQGWFVGKIADHLVEHGRTPVGWDDELVAGVKLPPSQVVMSWHGSDGQHVAREAAAQGHDVVLTPQESLYFDYYQSDLPDEWPGQPPMTSLHQAYDTDLVPKGATAAEIKRVIGVQGSLWSEFIPTFARVQHAVYPRMTALSELGWSSAQAHDWNDFLKRLPSELARYRALGIGYADSAFAPAIEVSAAGKGMLRVTLANQANFGEIRYTTDGSAPTAASKKYASPLEFSEQGALTLRAATFSPGGFELAAPRSRLLDASTLLSRDGSELAPCSKEPPTRLEGSRSAQGSTPVYKLNLGDMCWLWHHVPAKDFTQVAMQVGRIAWRFNDDAKGAVVRPKSSPGGEFEIHADSCTGTLLASMPLAAAALKAGQSELNAKVSSSKLNETRDLCIFATGDPRDGQWALARVAFSK